MRSLSVAALAITFTCVVGCSKQQETKARGTAPAVKPADRMAPATPAPAAKAPKAPPRTLLDVPKPGGAATVEHSIGGSNDREGTALYRHVRRKLPLVNACYARQRRRDPQLRGKLTVEATVGPAGGVKHARVVSRSSSLNSASLEGCVVATIKGFRFKRKGRQPFTLTLPLLFR